jgi:hypothetical protein
MEVISIERIKHHARHAAEAFDRYGTHPINPHAPETEAYRVWTSAYYQHSIDIEIDVAA